MDYNKPQPPPPPFSSAVPQYEQQRGGEVNKPPPANLAPPPYGQQQGQQAQVTIATPMSLEGMIGYIARGAAIATTFLATVIVATSKQTKGSDYDIEFVLKFSKYSALKYFLAANIILFIYSIASLLMSILIRSKSLILRLSNTIVDILLVSLLLTANGAASAISTQLDETSDATYTSVCSVFGKFCSQIKASIVMSMLAVGLYLALIILSLVTFAYRRN